MAERVRVLDKSVSDKIAAGEVVENPASVVKELVENSIDAGASSVVVEIEQGGKSLIKVTDNGCGLDRADIRTAFLRHATSKIHRIEDLGRIYSLGFRGEALASIAAVSRVRLITKTEGSIEGTCYAIHGGNEIELTDIGCADGTSIEVADLFYNTPARREYLKSDGYEASLVGDIITRIALARPDVSFRLFSNGRLTVNTPGDRRLDAVIAAVYGREIAEGLIRIGCSGSGIKAEGYISKPHMTRSNRNYQSFFVNGRFIRSRQITRVLEEAYRTMLMVNRYPVAVLNITADPSEVDVNVHPAKLEVRFRDFDGIRNMLHDCIRTNLRKGLWIDSVAKDIGKGTLYQQPVSKTSSLSKHRGTGGTSLTQQGCMDKPYQRPGSLYRAEENGTVKADFDLAREDKNLPPQESIEYYNNEMDNIIKDGTGKIPEMKIIGQFMSTYILAEGKGCIYLIDQHAAHERIMYESMLKQAACGSTVSQRLIEPLVIEMTPPEIEAIKENTDIIRRIGFEIEDFGPNTIAVRAVPMVFGVPQTKEFIEDLATALTESQTAEQPEMRRQRIIKIACKKAVKANQRLTVTEMEELIEQLGRADMPFTCPHGRPVMVPMTKYQLEKMFKRVQQ
jgi:DNA mismatch repair protein MutL